MRKFIYVFVAMFTMAVSMSAQNYASKSKFFDNWSIGVKGGVLTPYTEGEGYFKTISPTIGLNVNKELSPWFGLGLDVRTLLNGEGYHVNSGIINEIIDSKTTFDAVNVSANARFNLTHIFYPSKVYRRTFEPIAYVGLGWGHTTDEGFSPWTSRSQVEQPNGDRNYMTFRSGIEFNVNLGKAKAWAIYVDPSIVWGNIRDMRLDKRHSNLELLAGVKYYFKTSNGTHSWVRHECPEPLTIETIKEVPVIKEVVATKIVETANAYAIQFAQNSSDLTSEARAILDKIPTGKTYHVVASTSPEGTEARNTILQQERAVAVANYLTARGIRCTTGTAEEARQATITVVQK